MGLVGRPYGTATLACSVLALALVLDAGPATPAIKLPEDKAVTDRPRPAFDPLGARVGAFLINPRIEIIEAYNNNIFAEESGEVNDLITVVHPSLTVKSETSLHFVRFNAGARIGRYADRSTEDFEDFDISADGRIDVLRGSQIFGSLQYRAMHEDRSSVDDANGKEPVQFSTTSMSLGGSHEFNRLSLHLDGRAKNLDFDDAATDDGVAINQDDRDRSIYRLSLRTAYELTPEYEGFIRTSYNIRDYDAAVDDDGLNRDSNGYEIAAGATADFSGVTFGEVSIGYLSQKYDDTQLDKIGGFTFGALVTWNPSSLTTVKGWSKRLVKETTQIGVSGVLQSEFGISIDHELLRQLIVHAELSFTSQEYRGSTREDDLTSAVLSAKYMLNRNYYVGAEYRFSQRDSTTDTSDYDQSVFSVRFGLQY